MAVKHDAWNAYYWHCSHSIAEESPRNGQVSAHLSVPSLDRCNRVRRVRCWALRWQEISIDSGGRPAAHRTANASSVTFTAAVEGWTDLFAQCRKLFSLCKHLCYSFFASRTTCPIFTNFVYLLHMAVAQSSGGGVAICYLLSVVWITSSLHVMAKNRWREKGAYSKWLNRRQHGFDTALRRMLKLTDQGAAGIGSGVEY